MSGDPGVVAAYDQLVMFARDEGRRFAAYYQALRDGGVPAVLAKEAALAWQQKLLWPCEGCRDSGVDE